MELDTQDAECSGGLTRGLRRVLTEILAQTVFKLSIILSIFQYLNKNQIR